MKRVIVISLFFALGAGLSVPAAPPESFVIFDTFLTGSKMTPIQGRIPDKVNAPGGKWATARDLPGGDVGSCMMGSLDRHAPSKDVVAAYPVMQGNLSMDPAGRDVIFIPLASQGDYRKPVRFTISADLGGYYQANAALGFYSAPPETDANHVVKGGEPLFKNFTGLIFAIWSNTKATPAGRANGALTLYENGKPGPSVAFTGIFDNAHAHRLSYDVDTASGAISNVRLSGSTSDYSAFKSKAFTDAATAYAAVGNAMSLLSDTMTPGHRVWVVVNNFRVGVNLDPALPVATGK